MNTELRYIQVSAEARYAMNQYFAAVQSLPYHGEEASENMQGICETIEAIHWLNGRAICETAEHADKVQNAIDEAVFFESNSRDMGCTIAESLVSVLSFPAETWEDAQAMGY